MPVPLSTSTLSTLGQHLPIPAYQHFNDSDLEAIFAYLQ